MIVLLAALVLSAPVEASARAEPIPAAAPAPPRSTFANGVLNLSVGEKAVLRMADDGSFVFVNAGPQDDAAPEPGTISLSLSNQTGTTLLVRSGLTKAFRYDAYFDRARRQRTSICTVLPGLMGFENWGQALSQMTLTNFRTVPSDQMTCE